MKNIHRGFTLIELVTVMILVGILSIALLGRLGSAGTAAVQSGRDDLIAALFFAQQQAMMRPGITFVIAPNSISVHENGSPIMGTHYPLAMPAGITLTPATISLAYDKLGRTTATDITLTGSGNSSGMTTNVRVEASGYAFAN